MAISSIHIEAGKAGYFAHNSRESETVNSIFSDEENYCSCSSNDAFKTYRKELEKRTKAYLDNHTSRKKLHAKTITHLSSIVNFNKEHTKEDIEKVCDYLEEKLDTKIIQFAMHRDEGHVIEEDSKDIHESIKVDTEVKNYHAHIEMMGLDSMGNSIRRKLTKSFLKQLQTDVAKLLKMERGQESGYSKEEYEQIKAEMKPLATYKDKAEYNSAFNQVAKDLGFYKRAKPKKRLGTYEYKAVAKELAEAKKELAKVKDLKAEITKLRAELKEQGATRADYAELEQLNRELKEKIKKKDLTKDELKEELEKTKKEKEHLKSVVELKDIEIAELKAENEQLKEQLKETNENAETSYEELLFELQEEYSNVQLLEKQVKELQEENKELRSELEEKDQEIEDLNQQLETLQKQSNAYYGLNQDLKEEINSLKSIINDLESKKRVLDDKSIELDTKNDSRPNMSDSALERYKQQYKDSQKSKDTHKTVRKNKF